MSQDCSATRCTTARLLSEAVSLSDRGLVDQVKHLAHRERAATAALIAHLAVLDERRLYLAEGCSSLFTYCVEILHLAEHAAYNRIEAARAARKYPVILDRLAAGAIHLTAVRLLAPHLTSENHIVLLDEARHLRTRQVEEIVARLQPRPPVPASIRMLPSVRPVGASKDAKAPRLSMAPEVPMSLARRPVVEPLAPGQYRVQLTVDEETRKDLQTAQDLLRQRLPTGDLATVVKLALRALLSDLARQKYAAAKPQPADRAEERERAGTLDSPNGSASRTRPSDSRYIPAHVRRAVWERDAGRCGFVAADGRRCSERGFLEFHHVEPFALGGAATIENIQLRCRAHNGYEAERCFAWRDRSVREPRGMELVSRRAAHPGLRASPSRRRPGSRARSTAAGRRTPPSAGPSR